MAGNKNVQIGRHVRDLDTGEWVNATQWVDPTDYPTLAEVYRQTLADITDASDPETVAVTGYRTGQIEVWYPTPKWAAEFMPATPRPLTLHAVAVLAERLTGAGVSSEVFAEYLSVAGDDVLNEYIGTVEGCLYGDELAGEINDHRVWDEAGAVADKCAQACTVYPTAEDWARRYSRDVLGQMVEQWPYRCVDWARAARELEAETDYHVVPIHSGSMVLVVDCGEF